MNYKALTIGGVTQDIFITYYEDAQLKHLHNPDDNIDYILLRDGGRLEIEQPKYNVGGGALNSATTFAKLGFDTTLYSMVGNDHAGEQIINYLTTADIRTHHILMHATQPTGHSYIFPGNQGNRIVFAHRGANTQLPANKLPTDRYDVVYCAALPGDAAYQLPQMAKYMRNSTKLFACNPGINQLQCPATELLHALKYIDILIVNGYESQLLLQTLLEDSVVHERLRDYDPSESRGHSSLELINNYVHHCGHKFSILHYFQELLDYGPRILVVTNGKEGVYIATRHEAFFHPALPAQPINTVGAGDAFGSCFAASLIQGYSVYDACIRGLINSTSILNALSSHEGILSGDKLDKAHDTFDASFISLF